MTVLAEAGISCDGLDAVVWRDGRGLVITDEDGDTVLPEDEVERAEILEELLGAEQAALAEGLIAARTSSEPPMLPGITPELHSLWLCLIEYLVLHDMDYVLATLAAATAKVLPDDPLWLMLVSPSSSGKTEALKLLWEITDAKINDVTVAGLLGRGNRGVLARLQGADALGLIPDFSAVLGNDKRSSEAKGNVFVALRDIYDGEYHRDINPDPLHWYGRLSLIAACTPVIDSFSAHADALGTRWLYFRMKPREVEERREAAYLVLSRRNTKELRAEARVAASRIVLEARERVHGVELPAGFERTIVDTGMLAAYGRTVVTRDWRGDDIDDVVEPEEPGRLIGQLRMLALGLLALGCTEQKALAIVGRAALSSMKQERARVLVALASAEDGCALSTTAVERAAGLAWRPCKRALQDWEAIGFVRGERAELDTPTAPSLWSIAPEHADLVKAVATADKDFIELGGK